MLHYFSLQNYFIGLSTSLDTLLEKTSQTECNAPPSHSIDAGIKATVTDPFPQISSSDATRTCSQPITPPDSSHEEQIKDVSHIAKSKELYGDLSPQKSVAHDLNVQASSSDAGDMCDQTFTHSESSHQGQETYPNDWSTLEQDQTIHTTPKGTSTVPSASNTLTNKPHQVMLHYNDKLITALSADPLGISGILLAKGFIPEITEEQMRQCYTSREKASILVTTVRQKIEIAPKRFHEFLNILSGQTWTKDIVEILRSSIFPEHSRKDVSIGTDDQFATKSSTPSTSKYSSYGAVCEGHMYTAWVTLDPDDKIDLEAKLINDAETIGEEFAHLCWKARDSFELRGITPQTLASALLDITVFKDPSASNCFVPLLKEKEETLTRAQSVHETFCVLRPHMSFFNYEILQFLIEGKGSEDDKVALATFLRNFEKFCKRHVFEVPFTTLSNGHHFDNPISKQRLHMKVTKHFKAAFLIKNTSEAVPSTNDSSQAQSVCSSKLGINLEDAKNIQRKLAKILDLNPSSLFLDSITEGSVILTFLLPQSVTLAGLDSNPEIVLLSSNGVIILCGPPGKPQLKELTPVGVVVQWSQPEYGCNSLAQYILYYQKKCEHETNEWQKFELCSFETHTPVSDLDDGDTYVFKICTVSDVGTLQYSNESDPIVWSGMRYFISNTHKVISTCSEMLTLMLSSTNIMNVATSLLAEGIISKEVETQISLALMANKKAVIIVDAIRARMELVPKEFEKFVQILSDHSPMNNVVQTLWSEFGKSVCYQYMEYLKWLYANLNSKHSSSNQWPPSATKQFFRLAMIQTPAVQRGKIDDRFVQMTITGKVDDILRLKYPIKLEKIFCEAKRPRNVVLLEGAPGCGKSTLSVYICQQWEKDQLFNQFKLVILVRLRDPAVQNAKCLADLLPCPDTKSAQFLERIMMEMKYQGVLFILDGWDELPFDLRIKFEALVNSNLPWSNPLSKSTAIVTSRPISSGDLYPCVSSRVEILGFTPEELHQFFMECLKGDTEAVKTLLERIEENPEVAGSCYLPLNATILVHLFKNDRSTLPTTLYGIFSSLVLHCMKRHIKERTQHKNVSIESLDQLPEVVKNPFKFICQLAYDAVMKDIIVFTSLSLDVNTLSLLQGVESFIGQEKKISYSFIHLSIQELLAAWYIATWLPASEQVSKFNELFNKARFSAVFRFYTAITKLKTPGIKDVIVNVVKKYSKNRGYDIQVGDKALLLSLLHCLYEAQDSSLCESVALQLQHGLTFSNTTLTPSDCLCIGYFLAHVCKMTTWKFEVKLDNCSIGDQGCKYLVSGLHKYLDTHSTVTTTLTVDMSNNAIGYYGVHQILSTLLMIGGVEYLELSCNKSESAVQGTIHAAFAEQLKYNTTLTTLRLQGWGLTSESAESLAEALTTNKHLELLSISDNALCDDGIQHIAQALRVNQSLKFLDLMSCGMTDVGFECLVKSLQDNKVLNELYVHNSRTVAASPTLNRITEKIVTVLTECLQNNNSLIMLGLPQNVKSSTTSIQDAVSDVRKRSGMALIKGISECMLHLIPCQHNSWHMSELIDSGPDLY